MAPEKSRRNERVAERRAAIVHASRVVFARNGYTQTLVEDIAEQAGIAKGTLYLYFRSKEEIYMAVLLEDARVLDAQTRDRMNAVGTWDQKVRAFLQVRLEYLDEHEDFLRIYFSEIRSLMLRGAPMQAELFQVMRDHEEQLARMFAAAIAGKEIRSVDPELAAVTVCDLTHGLIERRLMGWSRTSDRDAANFLVDILCQSLAVR